MPESSSPQDKLLEIVKDYISPLISISDASDRKIKDALKKYDLRNERLINLANKEKYPNFKPQCLFDWAVLASYGDVRSISFLRFLSSQAQELLESIEPKFYNKVKATVTEMIFTFSPKEEQFTNPLYMNFVGEIVGLSHIINSTKGNFKLIEIERKLPNDKRVDYVLRNLQNNELLYIDFVSIHNIDVTKIETDENLVKFLEGKFSQKLESKTGGLEEDYNRILHEGQYVNFAILPIIWTEISELLRFKGTFEKLEEKSGNVFSCFSLLPQESDDATITYQFCEVNHILESWSSNKQARS